MSIYMNPSSSRLTTTCRFCSPWQTPDHPFNHLLGLHITGILTSGCNKEICSDFPQLLFSLHYFLAKSSGVKWGQGTPKYIQNEIERIPNILANPTHTHTGKATKDSGTLRTLSEPPCQFSYSFLYLPTLLFFLLFFFLRMIDLLDNPAVHSSTQELSAGTFTAPVTGLFGGPLLFSCYWFSLMSPKTACIYCGHTHVSHYVQKSLDWWLPFYFYASP